MKAVVRTRYGSPDVLSVEEVAMPAPKGNEVLIRVFATTVNRTDCAILSGKPLVMRLFTGLFKPGSPATGTDFAGRIEAVGNNVRSFRVGDKVWGFNDTGLASHAQFMTLPEGKALAIIPGQVTYKQAAASLEGAHYACNFINKVKLTPGQKVLVNGATGAIGSALVQMLKYSGVEVTAVCSTKNIDLVKSLGAHRVIDYTTHDFTKDPHQYHFVFDAVGKSSFGPCKPLLLPGGAYLSSELGPRWENMYLPLLTAVTGNKKVIFPIPSDTKKSILFMTKLFEEGRFKAVIDREYSLERIAEAYQYVVRGQKTGNVVITLADENAL